MSEWKTYRLGDICQVLNGRAYKQEELLNQGPYPVLRVGNIFQGNNWYYSDLELPDDKYCYNGDLLYAWSCGFAPYIWKGKKSIYHYHIWKLKENPQIIDKLFFYYYLIIHTKYNLGGTHGSVMLHLTKKDFENQTLHLPPLDEQRRIAGILGSLDDKIELNRRINANLEAQAQALFQSWFVDFEPFRDGPFVDSQLGKIPASLKIEHIGNIPHKIESGKRPKGGASEHGIPSIGAENIKGLGIYDYAKTKFIPEDFASTMKKGKINGYELLIYKDGGKPGYFIPNFTIFGEGFPYKEMYINEHVFCLDFFDKGFNTFAYFYMRTPYIMNQLNTIGGKAAIPGINTKDIESLPIFTNENEKVKEFGTLFLPTIKTILQNCVENKTLSALRDTLLPKLIAGEI